MCDTWSLHVCRHQRAKRSVFNMLDMASHYQVVSPGADKNPLTVFYEFLLGWCLTLGVPECLRLDLGGEFESSFSELAEQIGCRLLPAAAVSPTQNAPCERAGGASKYHARRLVDQFSIKWKDSSTKLWLGAVLNWSTNTATGDSGHSPSQWVLGRSLRLPLQLFSHSSQLACHQRHRDDFSYRRHVAMLAEAQRSIISTKYNKALNRAFLSRARSANNAPSQVRFAVRDQVMYWGGNNKRKSQLSMRWLDPGIVIGHEGLANVWISHRNAVFKAAGNHVRQNNFRGMTSTIPFVTQMNRYTLISVRLVRPMIPSMKVHQHWVMLQWHRLLWQMSQCRTPLQVNQSHPRSQCCPIPQRMHQCATDECVGAQMFWDSLLHRQSGVSPQSVPTTTTFWPTPMPTIYVTPP